MLETEPVTPVPNLTAPELILSLLDSAPEPRLKASDMVAAGALLGIDPRALRVAVVRLVRKGVLAQETRGRYRVGERGGRLHRTALGWSRVEAQLCRWDGSWIGVFTAHLPRTPKAALRARERALRLRGFALQQSGLALRPANLCAGIGGVREQLLELGLDAAALVLRIGAEDPQHAIVAERLWDLSGLERRYRDNLAALHLSTARVPKLDTSAAARETLLLGRRVIRDILMDPLLPDALLNVALRRDMVAAMQRYDRLGKQCWRAFYRSLR